MKTERREKAEDYFNKVDRITANKDGNDRRRKRERVDDVVGKAMTRNSRRSMSGRCSLENKT